MEIYIVQMHSRSVPSRLVKLATRYPYSHVGISLSRDCNEIYSFGRKSLHNVLNGGFVKECRDGAFFQKFNKTVCKVYALTIQEIQYKEIQKQLVFMEAHADQYRYDFFGTFLRLFRIPAMFQDKYVCSTFVAGILQNAGVCRFEKRLCFVKPMDFEYINGITQIYVGKYHQMAMETTA